MLRDSSVQNHTGSLADWPNTKVRGCRLKMKADMAGEMTCVRNSERISSVSGDIHKAMRRIHDMSGSRWGRRQGISEDQMFDIADER